MTAPIGSTTKTPSEVKRYKIDYTDWLDTGETVISPLAFSYVGNDNTLSVTTSTIDGDGLGITFFVSGGTDGNTYEVIVTIVTSGGQTKQDVLLVVVASL